MSDIETKCTLMKLWTIGHSNHSIESFLGLLRQHQITALADVRSHPYSRHLPHFNKAPLQASLVQAGIHYVFLGRELGARPDDPGCYVEGKALYEKIALTPLFLTGIQRLVKGTETHRIALMCAEKDPIACHRTILVCHQLRPFDLDIAHILSDGQLESHADLEERLLQLHNLKPLESEPQQLDLLDLLVPSVPPLSKAEMLELAYQRQGDRIAHVEKTDVEKMESF